MDLKKKIDNIATKTAAAVANSLSQDETKRETDGGDVDADVSALFRSAAAEGAVLLENNGVLPLKENSRVALFGITSYQTHFVGYGSGGDVNKPYAVSIADGIRNCGRLTLDENIASFYNDYNEKNPINHGFWAHWPFYYPEAGLDIDFVRRSSFNNDTAVVTIGRSAGEDRDCKNDKGSWLLADDEADMLDKVTAKYDNVIVLLNIGGIFDLSWLRRYKSKIGAVLIIWQGGMESGNAAADILCGKVCPSGKLTDTIANSIDDYPSSKNFGDKDFTFYKEDIYVGYRYFETFAKNKVVYPFGYGLSYTTFDIKKTGAKKTDSGFEFKIKVTNTGRYTGRQTVEIYLEKPCEPLGEPALVLTAFKKTGDLKPGESETVTLISDDYALCSYDDEGVTGYKNCYVINKGEFAFYMGENVRDVKKILTYYNENTVLYDKKEQVCAPKKEFDIMAAKKLGDSTVVSYKKAVVNSTDLRQRIISARPESIPQTGDRGYKLSFVKSGKCTMREFIAQLDNDELEAISRGDYTMNSPLGAKGNAGVFGGVLESLRDKGVMPVTTTDGPSGIRLSAQCSLLPCGTLLACTFNPDTVEKVYSAVAKEMKKRGSDVLLAPGMNIHRNPLCGRNFEYYSEDPLVAGKIAAAAVRGIQSEGASACPKHFACNNQEFRRNMNDSVVSERALREIYLKGFEICVKEGEPKSIMTSYNKVNSVYSHYNYDLCTAVLRSEWRYKGNVMTDWWMKKGKSPEFKNMSDQAYRVTAQVDVLMPGGSRGQNRTPDGTMLKSLKKKDGITLGEMQRTAENVLNLILDIKY